MWPRPQDDTRRVIGEHFGIFVRLGGPIEAPRIRYIRRWCGWVIRIIPTHWQAEVRKALRKYRIEDILRPSYNNVVQENFSERIARRSLHVCDPLLIQELKGQILMFVFNYWFDYQFGRLFIACLIGWRNMKPSQVATVYDSPTTIEHCSCLSAPSTNVSVGDITSGYGASPP